MAAILQYLLPLSIVILANIGVRHRVPRALTYVILAVLDLLIFAFGFLLGVLPFLYRLAKVPLSQEVQAYNPAGLGTVLVITGALGFLCLLPPLRRALARLVPLDPASPVHTTALVFFVYLAASSLGLLLTSQELVMRSLAQANPGPLDLVLEQAVFALLALAGVGFVIRRNVRETLQRLGIRRLHLRDLGVAVLAIVGLLALDYVTSLLWRRFWPGNYKLVSDASQQLFARFSSPLGGVILGLTAGIGEETLFRGALQPRFRIPLTAALFAVSHVQYALSPTIASIFVVGLVLGWIRERFSTSTCMVIHAIYNFLNVVLMPLLP